MIEQTWDSTTGVWLNTFKSTITGDTAGKVNEIIDREWNDGIRGWENLNRFVFSYNTRENSGKIALYDWNPGTASWDLVGDYITVTYAYSNAIKPDKIFSSHKTLMRITQRSGIAAITLPGAAMPRDGLSVYDLRGRLMYSGKPVIKGNKTLYLWDSTAGTKNGAARQVYIIFVRHKGKMITERFVY